MTDADHAELVQLRDRVHVLAPFWNMITPPQVLHVAPPFVLFVGAMIGLGLIYTKGAKSWKD